MRRGQKRYPEYYVTEVSGKCKDNGWAFPNLNERTSYQIQEHRKFKAGKIKRKQH